MRRAAVLFAATLVTLSLSAAWAAPQEKWARGKVTAISATAVTLDVNGKPMTFAIDTATTKFIARGGTTKTKEAERTGVKLTIGDIVKVGDNVEVRYEESGTTMLAKELKVGVAGSARPSSDTPKTQTLEGVVTEASGTTLSIKTNKGDVSFVVDPKTRVTGQGLGTMAKEKQAAGSKMTLSDAVAVGDDVVVTYTTMGEMKHATAVRVARKKT
jgi:hypothetical protein